MAGPKIGCAAWLFDSPPYTVWGRLRSVSATAPKPNQALERTDSADSVMSAFRFTFRLAGRSVWVVRRRSLSHE
jgi:hypothetical protein